jgi:hypothetical protein
MPRGSGRQNKLTGQVGEDLVDAELARRQHVVTTFAGNLPEFDVSASDVSGKHVSVQVKSTSFQDWQFDISRFCRITFRGKQQIATNKYKISTDSRGKEPGWDCSPWLGRSDSLFLPSDCFIDQFGTMWSILESCTQLNIATFTVPFV